MGAQDNLFEDILEYGRGLALYVLTGVLVIALFVLGMWLTKYIDDPSIIGWIAKILLLAVFIILAYVVLTALKVKLNRLRMRILEWTRKKK